MVKGRTVSVVVLCCLLTCCERARPVPKPAPWRFEVGKGPSSAEQDWLRLPIVTRQAFEGLRSHTTFHDTDGVFGGGEWTFNKVYTPRLLEVVGVGIRPADRGFLATKWIPLETNGDAADLYRRITGKEHPTLKGELSADYKAFLEGKGR